MKHYQYLFLFYFFFGFSIVAMNLETIVAMNLEKITFHSSNPLELRILQQKMSSDENHILTSALKERRIAHKFRSLKISPEHTITYQFQNSTILENCLIHHPLVVPWFTSTRITHKLALLFGSTSQKYLDLQASLMLWLTSNPLYHQLPPITQSFVFLNLADALLECANKMVSKKNSAQ